MADGRIVWVARYRDHRGNVRIAKPDWNDGKGTFTLKREAQRAIDEAVAGQTPERASTVEGYLRRWLVARPRSERTNKTNEGRIRNVVALELEGLPLGLWDMRDLRRRHADELVALMLVGQRRSPGGARNILRALSAMFEDAITDEFCEVNPWMGVRVRNDDRRAEKGPKDLRVWTFEQMHAFAAAASTRKRSGAVVPAPQYEPMLRTLADCGLRVGELFALRRASLSGDVLTVEGSAWEGQVYVSSAEKNHDRQCPSTARLPRGAPGAAYSASLAVAVPDADRQALAVQQLPARCLEADCRGRRDRPDPARVPPLVEHAPARGWHRPRRLGRRGGALGRGCHARLHARAEPEPRRDPGRDRMKMGHK
jgi:integrase